MEGSASVDRLRDKATIVDWPRSWKGVLMWTGHVAKLMRRALLCLGWSSHRRACQRGQATWQNNDHGVRATIVEGGANVDRPRDKATIMELGP